MLFALRTPLLGSTCDRVSEAEAQAVLLFRNRYLMLTAMLLPADIAVRSPEFHNRCCSNVGT